MKRPASACPVQSFEAELRLGFSRLGVTFAGEPDSQEPRALILAVSGGADSTALLTGAARLCAAGSFSPKLRVLTIDHGIRPPAESGGDARFVADYCESLGVPCETRSLGEGGVAQAAELRGLGTEDAARFLRYREFERSLSETPDSFLCLAHTRDDNLETILLRFLQGSASGPLGGILPARGRVIRPMLSITRAQVEAYLAALGVPYRRDSTNSDTAFARNRIRLALAPVLNERFPGWDKAVLQGAEKARDDAEAIGLLAKIDTNPANNTKFPEAEFFTLPRAVRREMIYGAADSLAKDFPPRGALRLPYGVVSRVIDGDLPQEAYGLVFIREGGNVLVRKKSPGKKTGFFAILEGAGACVRPPLPGDCITFASGETKTLSHLFKNAGIPEEARRGIPVVEVVSGGKPFAAKVLGEKAGYRNWLSGYSENKGVARDERAEQQTAF